MTETTTTQKPKARPRFTVRMPEALETKVRELAEVKGQFVNAVIVEALWAYVQNQEQIHQYLASSTTNGQQS